MIKTGKVFKTALGVAAGLLAAVHMTACSGADPQNEYEKALLGKWAYIHDLETEAASFQSNGKATFEGEKYDFSCDGEYISFSDGTGENLTMRYEQNDDGMYVYIKSRYVLEDGSNPDGVAGVWVCPEKKWTYEFTDKGTFMEDGVLTGHYFVDEENGTIRLVYGAELEDTVFYYRLNEEGLFVEYPWFMKRM